MACPSRIVVGLKLSEKEWERIPKSGLAFIGCDYETSNVWIYRIEKVEDFYADPEIEKEIEEKKVKHIFGIKIAETWNGSLELDSEEFRKRVEKAKKLFRKITGIEGKLIWIGEQT